jgi:Squalene-hopene cyclase C-terminal domain
MIAYRGVLHDPHLYAVVRTALRAHGFVLSDAEYQAAAREQWRLGCWLRDRAFPERLAGLVSIPDYQQIAGSDPSLWHQLPLMAALGFRQTRALLGMVPADGRAGDTAALLGAIFNTGIALFDYVVDESPVGTHLFDLLNDDVVQRIFEPGSHSRSELTRAGRHTSDPRLRLLFGIVAAFGTMARELLHHSGNEAACAELNRLVVALFEAERAVSLRRMARNGTRDLLPALETKSALPSMTLLQVVLLASPQTREPLTEAHRSAAALGRIFWRIDDLVDLLADCRKGSPNALLLKVADRLAEHGRTWASDADLYDVVDATAEELVGLLDAGARGPFDFAAGEAGSGVPQVMRFARETVAGWARWHEEAGAISKVQSDRRSRGKHHGRAELAIDMLLAQQRNGYQEAVHHLCFPRHRADGLSHETHPALLFQRAVVLDSLLDARAAGLSVPGRVTDAEAMTILRLKHRDVRGGWSYIPEVPELPPDADDLGQVLQALTRLGGPALAFTCEEPIRLALDAAESHGGFPTWIFEPRRRSQIDRRMRNYLNVIGGAGIHPDVVANLLLGLLRYDAIRYRQAMRGAVSYLESVQDDRGTWSSHWYAGPYYGTYRVAMVLGTVTPGSAAMRRAKAFLLDDQQRDGGWGATGVGPLSTALAVLALAAPGMDCDDAAIERGVAYLIATQQADGGWPACPWISFQTLDGVENYGSRTITTAFSLKALVNCAEGILQRIPDSRPETVTARSLSL